MPPEQAALIDIGSLFTLTAPRFNWGSGKLLVCTGMMEDYVNNTVIVEGFG